jgi:hypothetical protein
MWCCVLCAMGSEIWSPWGNLLGLKIQKNSNNFLFDLEQFLVRRTSMHDAIGSSELEG